MILIYFFIAVFVSFFILYSIARHDFVLLRQNISLKSVFDNAFLALFISFLFGRMLFAVSTNHLDILSPLKFLYLSKFWGVSLYIVSIVITAVIYVLFRKRKNILRISDIYTLAFCPLLILDILFTNGNPLFLQIKIPLLIFAILLLVWFFKLHKNYSTKDGFLSAAIFCIFSLITFAFSALNNGVFRFPFLIIQIISLIIAFLTALLMFLIQKNIINKS